MSKYYYTVVEIKDDKEWGNIKCGAEHPWRNNSVSKAIVVDGISGLDDERLMVLAYKEDD